MPAASGKVSGKLVVVTGIKELDAKLKTLPDAMQRKFIKGGLRKGIKRADQDFKRIVKAEAYDTGALAKSTKAKALKRSRKRVGVALFTSTKKLYAERAKKLAKRGQAAPKEEFYPAFVEFGSATQKPVKPLRRALYDNAKVYQAYFITDVKQFIAENKVTLKLAK